jgi:hypothetical protein
MAQSWIQKPKSQWPQIAMINEVWYKNGERYIHPSFEYAATGFLISTGKDTFAVTAKHVLWIAKTKSMNAVHFQNGLQRWIMHPKDNLRDSVVIDNIMNEDPREYLNGPGSSITQRDWLVFKIKYASKNIQPLMPKYSSMRVGDKVWFFGCPYAENDCVAEEGTVVEVEGNRIVFTKRNDLNLGGASGSPIVDTNGYLVGILSGSATVKMTGEPATFGISTHYLKKVLENQTPLNTPLVPIGDAIKPIVSKKGIEAGLTYFAKLKRNTKSYFVYDYSIETINALGDEYLNTNRIDWALAVYNLSISELPMSGTYVKIAHAYLKKADQKSASDAYRQALKLWPENEEAKSALKELQKDWR